MCRCSCGDRVCATVSRMRLPAPIVALLAVALCATFTSSAVATPNVVDQYTEQPPTPGGGPNPGGGPGPGGGGFTTGGGGFLPWGSNWPGYGSANSSGASSDSGDDSGALGGRLSPAERAERGESVSQAEAAAGGEQVQSSPAAVESSSLGLGFPIVLLLIAAAVAVLAYRRRQDSTRLQG